MLLRRSRRSGGELDELGVVMIEASGTQVVLRYRDGATERCHLAQEFSPRTAVIEAVTPEGQPLSVQVDQLKAVFFLKDPRRRDAELELGAATTGAKGAGTARAEFFDGEIMTGRVESYAVADRGFYLYPTEVGGNNERVFVVASALSTLSIESFPQAQ